MTYLKLLHYEIEDGITISEENFFTLVIENKKFLLKILMELKRQVEDGCDGGFSLTLNDKLLNLEKSASIIFDFTNINFNSRQIINLLGKKFSDFLVLGEQVGLLSQLESIILNLAEDFRLQSGLNVEYNTTMNGTNLAKVCSLKIADNEQNLLERLCEYVNLLCDLKPLKLIVLVFGKHFMSKKEIENFNKYCLDKDARLLLIEGADKTELLSNEKRLIIDEDLCTIPLGYSD